MVLDQVEVVLVRPARAANVAAAARAMKNMGLRRMRIVTGPTADSSKRRVERDSLARSERYTGTPTSPRQMNEDGVPVYRRGFQGVRRSTPWLDMDFHARASAYGAFDVLDAAARHETLEAALADCTFVVAASGRGGQAAWTPRQLAGQAAARTRSGRLGLVFGPEASGLTNAELRLCHEVVTIPSDPSHPSLNLAQAVLVVAYELFVDGREAASPAGPAAEEAPHEPPATVAAVEAALSELGAALLEIGYLNRENPGAITAELRRLLARAAPTAREVALLRGVARQIGWAASWIEATKQ